MKMGKLVHLRGETTEELSSSELVSWFNAFHAGMYLNKPSSNFNFHGGWKATIVISDCWDTLSFHWASVTGNKSITEGPALLNEISWVQRGKS